MLKKIIISMLFMSIACSDFPDSDYVEPPLEIEPVVSRTTGVAPLSVFFTGGFSDSTSENRDFHNLEYSWDFGDSTAGNWGTSGKSKTVDKGPVASHVYETPGTYNINLVVRDSSGIVRTNTFSITVTDPEVVFSGDKTTCISQNADFAGCPTGAGQITTDDISVMATYAESERRVLLHRGSTWTREGRVPFPSGTTRVQIGAYGNCNSSDEQGICANAPQINMTGEEEFLSLNKMHDLRLSDISFSGEKSVQGVISGAIDIQQLLILRVKAIGFGTPIGWSHWRHNDDERIAENSVVSCTIGESQGMTTYIGSEKLTFMGNIVYDSDETHIVRVFYSYQGVVSHNIISGASLNTDTGRHALKFHGPKPEQVGTVDEAGRGGLSYMSKFTIVANNVFGSSGPWPVSIGPQDSGSDERLSDIIIEKNKMLSSFSYGSQSQRPVQIGMMFEGRYISARNNILDGTDAANGYTGIFVARRGVEATPLGNMVYNNTIYKRGETVNTTVGIKIDVTANDTIVRNNFISFPNSERQSLIEDLSENAVIDHNILNNDHGFVDPDNDDPLLRDFSLSAVSPAINQGVFVPLLDDFYGTNRPLDNFCIGAVHYLSGE